jgi:hypothetical protein
MFTFGKVELRIFSETNDVRKHGPRTGNKLPFFGKFFPPGTWPDQSETLIENPAAERLQEYVLRTRRR